MYKLYPKVDFDTVRDGAKRRALSPRQLYAQSKFANILVSNELARRYGDRIVAFSLHPGVLRTELLKYQGFPAAGVAGGLGETVGSS